MTTLSDRPLSTITIERRFSTAGVHPYDEVEWETRDVVQANWKTGDTVFEQTGVEFPTFWSLNASTIVVTKYFRGALGTPQRETSLRQVIDRVVDTYTQAGLDHGYFTADTAAVFSDEMKWLLLHQHFAFNSPVWFNVGTTSPQQVSACFILAVDDTMDSILNWYREEGLIFKGGSGAGLNLSRIRSSKELLKSSGGTASGPVSFMRGADASAGTIKSGGATRRAAKMVVLDVDHPDIEEFIDTKVREEEKIRVLRDAGFDMDLGGADITSVQYQNANNSVRVSDEFMTAVDNDTDFGLTARTDGEVITTVSAKRLFRKMAEAAWACADPGIQYDGTINDWHTNPDTGRITASNPCSEYMSLDNSSCNLASLNLMKFLRDDDTFDVDKFTAATEIVFTAMDISICFADFPTDAIGDTTRNYRQLGIGYANLGAVLMRSGLAYDSPEGRSYAAAITALMHAVAYRRSAELSQAVGPYNGYERNKAGHNRVMKKHADETEALAVILAGDVPERNLGRTTIAQIDVVAPLFEHTAVAVAAAAAREWTTALQVGHEAGWRNAQASLLAPTGTIGFMMDVDTTGVEPDFSLVKFKKLVGGGSMQIVNTQVPAALRSLGYNNADIPAIEEHILENGSVIGAPGVAPEHYDVFDCAVGQRAISAMGHIRMMAAVQPYLSGAISKTVNLPETATVEEIEEVYFDGWKLGLKAIAVYRDNCKVGQPLSDGKAKDTSSDNDAEVEALTVERIVEKIVEVERPHRRRLGRRRTAATVSFAVAGAEGYLTTGEYDDGSLGEVFVKMSKQGSTLAGVMDAFSMAVSIGLQYGVPLETYVSKFVNMRFDPSGMTDDPDVRLAQSMLDYIFRRLALDYMPFDERSAFGIYTTEERAVALADASGDSVPIHQDEVAPKPEADIVVEVAHAIATPAPGEQAPSVSTTFLPSDAPMCFTCGVAMVRTGSCSACPQCGNTSGCS